MLQLGLLGKFSVWSILLAAIFETANKHFTATLRLVSWPSPRLAIINHFLTFLYLLIINPPMKSFLEIPAIFGASLSTLVIVYSVGDWVMGKARLEYE